MQRLLTVFVFCFVTCNVFGNINTSEYDTAEQHELVSAIQSDVNLIRNKDVQKIRNFIKNEDADFINQIANLNEEQQISLMRSWLAKRAFKFYSDKYLAEIRSKSEKTGRKIKIESQTSKMKTYNLRQVYIWLDRGALDEEQCQEDYVKRWACDYPDGFEEYRISYKTIVPKDNRDYTEKHLVIWKDDIATNSSKTLMISLKSVVVNIAENSSYDFYISADMQTEKYTDYHRWRNQEQADIRAGKYRKPTKQEQKEWKEKYKDSPFGRELGTITDDSREWDSNWLPDAAVTSINSIYRSDYNQTHIDE